MPISRIEVEFNEGCTQAFRYAYADNGGNVSGECVASLAENINLPLICSLYCAPREVENGFSVKKQAYAIKVILASPAPQNGTIVVSIYDSQNSLFQVQENFDDFPYGSRCNG
jgi:hypothetical protein